MDKLHGIISLLQSLAGSRAADPAAEKTAPAATGSQPAIPATQAPTPAASASSPKAAPVLTAAAGAAAVGKLAEAFNTLSDAETLALDKLLEDELDAQEVAETQPDQLEAEPEGTTPDWANPAPASPLPPANSQALRAPGSALTCSASPRHCDAQERARAAGALLSGLGIFADERFFRALCRCASS